MIMPVDFRYATPMWSGGYCDMPMPVKLSNGNVVVVMTVNTGAEGSGQQHIIALRSVAPYTSWTVRGTVEAPASRESAWGNAWTNGTRIYCAFTWNKNDIKYIPVQGTPGRQIPRCDSIGWIRVKQSDDEGATWQAVPGAEFFVHPATNIDNRNPYAGAHRLFWLSGQMQQRNGIVIGGMSKMGYVASQSTLFGDTEAYIVRFPAVPVGGSLSVLPTGMTGIRAPADPLIAPTGTKINEEPAPVWLDDNAIYGVFRTDRGRLAEFWSSNQGNTVQSSWCLDENGRQIMQPRANAAIHDLEDGRFLLWGHNNSGKSWTERNVGWYRLGTRSGHKISWGPVRGTLVFHDDPATGISYPGFVNVGSNVLMTMTNKSAAKSTLFAKADL
ncbi:MAG: hypothetical protein ACRCYS_05400 [Beijerinckiaceae bacterium]